ncbi:MAG: acyl-CoA dehydrogenase [Myxococcota bacterium]
MLYAPVKSMQLRLTEEQEIVRSTFARLFAEESTSERVRGAEPLGFDSKLHDKLLGAGVPGLRVPEALGGGGGTLLDLLLVAEQAGRCLASVPLLEEVLALALLARLPGADAREWLQCGLAGKRLIVLDLAAAGAALDPLVSGGAVADAVLGLDDEAVVLRQRSDPNAKPVPLANLGSGALAPRSGFDAAPEVLARGADAVATFEGMRLEWKIATAAALAGLARAALEQAASYASERVQFGRPIGSFQGVAHPLADSATEVAGARLLSWKAAASLARGDASAAALASMAFHWASASATRAVARALHSFGGSGLSLEGDIQLYHRRAKAWALWPGDPEDELDRVAEALWGDTPAFDVDREGEVGIDFGYGEAAERYAAAARAFFEKQWSPLRNARRHYAWEGYDPEFWKALGAAGFLYPAWPKVFGGEARSRYEMEALAAVFFDFGCTRHPIDTTGMVAAAVMQFGSEELKAEVLPRFARGEAISSLGYTEPGSGSDIAAAQTRAVFTGEAWRIDGQKMFTSGANLGDYVFLLARTDSEVPKHRGLTLFLVPLDREGIEVRPFETLSDERTNATYYENVQVEDRYRVGEVDGGWQVLNLALELEHGKGVVLEQRALLEGALDWARTLRRDGTRPTADQGVRRRLARAAIHTEVADALHRAALFAAAEGERASAMGPMAKLFSSDRFILDAADLMDLCAPDSLLRGRYGGGDAGAAAVEFAYRLSTATSIYGGTSEIMKSIIAQESLGLPRSRS